MADRFGGYLAPIKMNNADLKCSITTRRIDGGVLINISGRCSKENVMAIRDAMKDHFQNDPNFMMFEVSKLKPDRIENFVELCKDVLASRPRLFLIGPSPEISAELHKEIDEFGYKQDYWICDSVDEAMAIERKRLHNAL